MSEIKELKKENIQKIRKCFYEDKNVWTRPALSEKTGLSMTSVLNILKLLISRDEIQYAGEAESTGGRKSKNYELNPDYRHLGIFILKHQSNVFTVVFCSLNLLGEKICEEKKKVDAENLNSILHVCQDFADQDPLLKYIVISVPSVVSDAGMLIHCDFPALNQLNFGQELERMLAVCVRVENDVNLAAEGYQQKYPSCKNLVVLYQPDQDPAGSGLIINGMLYRGWNGTAGEIWQAETEKQIRLLKKDPECLVKKELSVLASIAAPERIAWCCPLIKHELQLEDRQLLFVPVLEKLDTLEELMLNGAETIGRRMIQEDWNQ